MNKYRLSFWFEHGGFCVWGKNDRAKEKYGYAIDFEELPISAELKKEIGALESEYGTYLDWQEPSNPPLWTKEHMCDFVRRATVVYEKLKAELGDEYEIVNEVHVSVE